MSESELRKELTEIKRLLKTMITDLNTMHGFVVNIQERLSAVEGFCIRSQPPKATPIP